MDQKGVLTGAKPNPLVCVRWRDVRFAAAVLRPLGAQPGVVGGRVFRERNGVQYRNLNIFLFGGRFALGNNGRVKIPCRLVGDTCSSGHMYITLLQLECSHVLQGSGVNVLGHARYLFFEGGKNLPLPGKKRDAR